MNTGKFQQKNSSFIDKLCNKQRILLVVLCTIGLLLSSCGSSSTGPDDNGGNGGSNGGGGGNGGDDTPSEPTFSNVQTIFNESCGGVDCHIGERRNGVRLDSYDNVMNSEGTQYGREIVVAGEPDNSPIIDKISNDNPQFGDRMPEGRAPLSDDEISLISDWIEEGAENN